MLLTRIEAVGYLPNTAAHSAASKSGQVWQPSWLILKRGQMIKPRVSIERWAVTEADLANFVEEFLQ